MDRGVWPATVGAVRHILDCGLELGPATVFVGENGAGKSTIVEALAAAFGLNPEGGTHSALHTTRASESELVNHLQMVRGVGASKRGVFLRAEAMHSHFTYLEEIRLGGLHERSHGEAFLDYVEQRSRIAGFWVLDEPESALSLSGCLALLDQLTQLVARGSQVVLSTHSPILAALPGADLMEVGPWGLRQRSYDDLDLVRGWRMFLNEPHQFLQMLGSSSS